MDEIDKKSPAPTPITSLMQCLPGVEGTLDQRDTSEHPQVIANLQAIGCNAALSDPDSYDFQPLLGQYARSGSAMILSSLGVGNPPITMTPIAMVIFGLITTEFAELVVDEHKFRVVVDPCLYFRLSEKSEKEWRLFALQLTDQADLWNMEISVSSQSLRALLSEFNGIAQQLSADPPSRTISPAPSSRKTRSVSPSPQSTLHPTPPADTKEYKLERLCTMAGYKELSTDPCGCASISCSDLVLRAFLIDPPRPAPFTRYRSLMSTGADGVWFNLENGECVLGALHLQKAVVLDRARILFEDPEVLHRIEAEFCVIFEAQLWDEGRVDLPPTTAHQRRTFSSPQETVAEIAKALTTGKNVKLVYASAKPKPGETEDQFLSRLMRESEDGRWTYEWYLGARRDAARCFICL